MSDAPVLVADFQVPGSPQPKGSQKNIGRRGARAVFVSANPALAGWTARGRAAAAEAMRRSGVGLVVAPVTVEAVFSFARPLNQLRKKLVAEDGSYALLERVAQQLFPFAHLVAPDCDKCCRAVNDLLTGIVVRDDSQVARCHAVKVYADAPGDVGTRVRVFIEDPAGCGLTRFRPTVRMSAKVAAVRAASYARRKNNA